MDGRHPELRLPRRECGIPCACIIGPDTNVAALEELISLVAGANESAVIGYGTLPAGTASSGYPYADYEGWPADWFIQDMVWTISEGGALSANDKIALAALP